MTALGELLLDASDETRHAAAHRRKSNNDKSKKRRPENKYRLTIIKMNGCN